MKRFLDIIVVIVALIPAVIISVPLAALIRWRLGGPVFFFQKRPGKDGRVFEMMKFRSMTNQRDENGELLPDAERLPKFGKLLRATSLDELPELWNVLKGDMSLVGPRPLLAEYLPLYDKKQARRHEVRPGITGWAQVNGRNATSWDERFEMDVWYVDNQSFWLDCKILWMTVLSVLKRDGVSAEGHVTMPKFEGSSGQNETTGADQ
ncbi:UNVERIFIED_CONTAM: hypothetical protein GTU68_004648 [Idotea baltica]|nr:hypothetical protein [Idotea baltica]